MSYNDDQRNIVEEEQIGLLSEVQYQEENFSNGHFMKVRSRSSSLAAPSMIPHHKGIRRSQTPSRMTQTGIVISFIIVLTLIMIWDMNKMYEMSELIHDDHNSLWEKMNDTALRTWWSPLDLCLLKMNDSTMDIKSYRAKNCNKVPGLNLSPNNEILIPKLFCNAGSSLGKACPPPLTTRHYFTYRLRDARYQNGRSTYLSDALKILAKRKMPLIFIGDGLSKQNEDAVICNLLRTDGNSISVLTGLAYLQQSMGSKFNRSALANAMIPDYVVKWKGMEKYPLEIKHYKIWAVDDEANEMSYSHKHSKNRKKRRQQRYLHHEHDHPNEDEKQTQDHSQWQSDSPLARTSATHGRKLLSPNNNSSKPNSSLRAYANKRPIMKNTNNHQLKLQRRIDGQSLSTNVSSASSSFSSNRGSRATFSDRVAKRNITTVNNTVSNTSNSAVNYNTQATPTIHFSFHQVQEALKMYITEQNRSVAVIANVGVVYNSREKFREEVPFFLSWLHHLQEERNDNLIFYRETAAQHWNHTEMGYYDETYREESSNNGTCVPIADNRLGLDWRNEDVYHILENEDFHHIRMIPFHMATMPLYNMHPTGAHTQDCTHYCYFPQMWQPVWYALYNASMTL